MAVSFTVFEFKRDRPWSKNASFSYPLPFNLQLHDHTEPLRFFSKKINTNCPCPWAIRWCKNIDEKFNLLSRAHELHRRHTDRRQTDGERLKNVCEYFRAVFVRNDPDPWPIRWRIEIMQMRLSHPVTHRSSASKTDRQTNRHTEKRSQ